MMMMKRRKAKTSKKGNTCKKAAPPTPLTSKNMGTSQMVNRDGAYSDTSVKRENPYLVKSVIRENPDMGPSVKRENPDMGTSVKRENPYIVKSVIRETPDIGKSVIRENPDIGTSVKRENSDMGTGVKRENPYMVKSVNRASFYTRTGVEIVQRESSHMGTGVKRGNPYMKTSVKRESVYTGTGANSVQRDSSYMRTCVKRGNQNMVTKVKGDSICMGTDVECKSSYSDNEDTGRKENGKEMFYGTLVKHLKNGENRTKDKTADGNDDNDKEDELSVEDKTDLTITPVEKETNECSDPSNGKGPNSHLPLLNDNDLQNRNSDHLNEDQHSVYQTDNKSVENRSDNAQSENHVENSNTRQNSSSSSKHLDDETPVNHNEETVLGNQPECRIEDDKSDIRSVDNDSGTHDDDNESESGFWDTPSEGRSLHTFSRGFHNNYNIDNSPHNRVQDQLEKSDEENKLDTIKTEPDMQHTEDRSSSRKDESSSVIHTDSLLLGSNRESLSDVHTEDTHTKNQRVPMSENYIATDSAVKTENDQDNQNSTTSGSRIEDHELSIEDNHSVGIDENHENSDCDSLHLDKLFETYNADPDSDSRLDDTVSDRENKSWWDGNFSTKYKPYNETNKTKGKREVIHPRSRNEDTRSCTPVEGFQMKSISRRTRQSKPDENFGSDCQNNVSNLRSNSGVTLADKIFKAIEEKKRNDNARLKRRMNQINSRGEFTSKNKNSKKTKEQFTEEQECLNYLRYPKRKTLADFRMELVTENYVKGSLAESRYKIIHSKTDGNIKLDCTCGRTNTNNKQLNNIDNTSDINNDDPVVDCQSQITSASSDIGNDNAVSHNAVTKISRRKQKQNNKDKIKMEPPVPDMNSSEGFALVYQASTNFVSKMLALGVIDYVEEKQEERFPWRDKKVDKEIQQAKEKLNFYKMVKWTDLYECSDAVLEIFNETENTAHQSNVQKDNNQGKKSSSLCDIL